MLLLLLWCWCALLCWQLMMSRPLVGTLAGGPYAEKRDTGQTLTLYVHNITNYGAHIAGAPAVTEAVGPFVFRRYEQRYAYERTGYFGELVSYKSR